MLIDTRWIVRDSLKKTCLRLAERGFYTYDRTDSDRFRYEWAARLRRQTSRCAAKSCLLDRKDLEGGTGGTWLFGSVFGGCPRALGPRRCGASGGLRFYCKKMACRCSFSYLCASGRASLCGNSKRDGVSTRYVGMVSCAIGVGCDREWKPIGFPRCASVSLLFAFAADGLSLCHSCDGLALSTKGISL